MGALLHQVYRAVKASTTENVFMRATTKYFCLLEFDTWIHCDFSFTELPKCPLALTDVLIFLAQEHLLEIKPDLDLTLSKYWLNCDLKQTSNTLHSQGHLFTYILGLFIQIIFHAYALYYATISRCPLSIGLPPEKSITEHKHIFSSTSKCCVTTSGINLKSDPFPHDLGVHHSRSHPHLYREVKWKVFPHHSAFSHRMWFACKRDGFCLLLGFLLVIVFLSDGVSFYL